MLFQVLSMVSFGLSNCFWYQPLTNTSPLRIITIRSFFTSVCFLLLVFLNEYNLVNLPLNHLVFFKHLNPLDIIKTIGLCFVNYWGLYFFLKSMQHTDARVSISVSSAGTIIWFIIGIYFYNESPPKSSYLFMLIFTIGWWFIENLSKEAWKLKWSKGVSYALLCMLFWRSGGFFGALIAKIGILYFSLILELTVCVTSVVLLYNSKNNTNIAGLITEAKKNKLNLVALVIFGFLGVIFYNIAVSSTSLYSFALIAMLQPLTSIIVGSFIFKTSLTTYQKIGIIILMTGMGLQMSNIV